MPLVPTQLLQFADGGTTQGFSTLYDLVKLNDLLVVAGKVEGTGIDVVRTMTQGSSTAVSGTAV